MARLGGAACNCWGGPGGEGGVRKKGGVVGGGGHATMKLVGWRDLARGCTEYGEWKEGAFGGGKKDGGRSAWGPTKKIVRSKKKTNVGRPHSLVEPQRPVVGLASRRNHVALAPVAPQRFPDRALVARIVRA